MGNKTTESKLISPNSASNERSFKKLQRERDELLKQVTNLACFNYAREPDFVRDRNKLRDILEEVSSLKRSIQSKYANRILGQLERAQEKINQEARNYEEQSERMMREFLDGKMKQEESKDFAKFIDDYIELRKNAHIKRTLADKLVKERMRLDESTTSGKNKNKTVDQHNSPTPTPRQRKRMSFVIRGD